MAIAVSILVSMIGLGLAWHLFYNVTKAKHTLSRKIKVTLVVLLFSSLIIRFSQDTYAWISRAIFSINKTAEVNLAESPFRIPNNTTDLYCSQFTNASGKAITDVSIRGDGKYCGQFWHFNNAEQLNIPFKELDSQHNIYWASPDLKIIAPKKVN